MPENSWARTQLPRTAAVLLAIVLSACSRDHRQADIKACVAKAQQQVAQNQLPYLVPNGSAEERHDSIGNVVTDCMEKQGYLFDRASMANARCVDDVAYNAFCYR